MTGQAKPKRNGVSTKGWVSTEPLLTISVRIYETTIPAMATSHGIRLPKRSRKRRRIVAPASVVMNHAAIQRSEEHTSELQSRFDLVCRLLLERQNSTTT